MSRVQPFLRFVTILLLEYLHNLVGKSEFWERGKRVRDVEGELLKFMLV